MIDQVEQYRITRKLTWEVIVTIKRSQEQLVQVYIYHSPYAYLILNILIIQSACNLITSAALFDRQLMEPLFLIDFSRSLSLCMLRTACLCFIFRLAEFQNNCLISFYIFVWYLRI